MVDAIIKHKFRDHKISNGTKSLIVGTFNPDTPKNTAYFFYGTGRNYLWELLPAAFGMQTLKGKDCDQERLQFMKDKGVDFIDVISEVTVDPDRAHGRNDDEIGGRVSRWEDVPAKIRMLPNLERVCFTRKTFGKGVREIEEKVMNIESCCKEMNIEFKCLVSPSKRVRWVEKQKEWTLFFNPSATK